jgi:flagellar hook-length control protein FliK
VPDAAQAPAIATATPVAVAAVVPVVAAAPTAAAPTTAPTTAPTIAAIPAAVAAPAASKEPEPVAGTPAAAVSKIAAVPAEAVAAAAVQEAAPGTIAFDPVTMPAPRPRQVATAANGRTEPAGKATAAVPADKAAAELAAPQAGRFQTARAEADATVAANSNQAQPQFRIVKADANAAAADAPTLAGAHDDRAAPQSGADQAMAGLTALDSPRQTAALYHKVADAAKAGADTPTPADQVSIRLVHAVAEGKRAIQMHLHPAELGSIDVKMQWQGDKLTAQFTVDRPETLQILQREVPALERSLGQAGVNVDSGSLSFSLRQQQGNGKGNGEGFNQAAANAGLGDGGEPGAGDAPLGQVIRDGILSIRV